MMAAAKEKRVVAATVAVLPELDGVIPLKGNKKEQHWRFSLAEKMFYSRLHLASFVKHLGTSWLTWTSSVVTRTNRKPRADTCHTASKKKSDIAVLWQAKDPLDGDWLFPR